MTADEENTQHVYLVRHGETRLNASGYIRGHADPPLDQAGMVEAHALGTVFAAKRIVQVISGPLDRAAHTARIIAEAVRAPHAMDESFNDRDYGPWTGYLEAKIVARWGSLDQAPGVETPASVLARTRPALDAVLDTKPSGPVVIVTHDAIIRPLIAAIDPTRTTLLQPTGCWNHLTRTNGTWAVHEIDQKPGQGNTSTRPNNETRHW